MRNRIINLKENRVELKPIKVVDLENDYRVFIWNRGTPRYIHYDSDSALKEGIKLAKKEGKKVLVVQTLFEIKPSK
mgnify:CR=1 FL=1